MTSSNDMPAPTKNFYPPDAPHSPFGAAIAWNVGASVVGFVIAFVGLAAGLTADPEESAIRQIVAATWTLCGIVGLLIAAVGLLGATVIHAIKVARPSAPPGLP
jgi:uncharacterized membrane protein